MAGGRVVIENVKLEPVPGPDASAHLILLPEREDGSVVTSFTTYAEVYGADGSKVFGGDVPTNIIPLDTHAGPFRFSVWDGQDRVDGGLDPEPGETIICHVRFAALLPPPSPTLKYWSQDFQDFNVIKRHPKATKVLTNPKGLYKTLRVTVRMDHGNPDMNLGLHLEEWQTVVADPDPAGSGVIVFNVTYQLGNGYSWEQAREFVLTFQNGPNDNTGSVVKIEGWYE